MQRLTIEKRNKNLLDSIDRKWNCISEKADPAEAHSEPCETSKMECFVYS